MPLVATARILFVVMAMSLCGVAAAKPTVGEPAPGFAAVDSHGHGHTLDEFRGKFVVLEWTNDGCPYVGKHYGTGNMQMLQKHYTEQGVVWLSVISSAPGHQGYVDGERANQLTGDRQAAPTAVLLDPEGTVGRLYGAKTTPHMYIVDPEGTLIYMGGIDDVPSARWRDVENAENYVRTALDEALAGKPVTTAITRPYGCSVKYGS